MPETAPRPQPRIRSVNASLSPIASRDFGYDQARHLLLRAGFGGTPHQIRHMAEIGPGEALDLLLDFSGSEHFPNPSTRNFDDSIMAPPSEAEQLAYRQALRAGDEDTVARFRQLRQNMQRQDRQQIRQMQRWWLTRMIESPRPLQEKLTLFWHGHFATGYRTIENSYHMFMQNLLFREHAAGNFGELLNRIIRDPAMLRYLNNDRNTRTSPNENLAREIMELFALGEGNYSERDIKEGARALTGYTFDNNAFVFREQWHDPGNKRILGQSGPMNGDQFVLAILRQRACSEFICMKLYEFFVAELPDDRRDPRRRAAESVIESLARTMRDANYELAPVLRRLFRSEHFYDTAIMADKIKSPVELTAGAVRTLNTPVRDLDLLLESMEMMGQQLFQPPNVAGWPGHRTWINTSTVYMRQNTLTYLLTGKLPRGFDEDRDPTPYDGTPLLEDLAAAVIDPLARPESAFPYLLRYMIGGPPRDKHIQILSEYVAERGSQMTPETITGCMALIAALPEYQLC